MNTVEVYRVKFYYLWKSGCVIDGPFLNYAEAVKAFKKFNPHFDEEYKILETEHELKSIQ